MAKIKEWLENENMFNDMDDMYLYEQHMYEDNKFNIKVYRPQKRSVKDLLLVNGQSIHNDTSIA